MMDIMSLSHTGLEPPATSCYREKNLYFLTSWRVVASSHEVDVATEVEQAIY